MTKAKFDLLKMDDDTVCNIIHPAAAAAVVVVVDVVVEVSEVQDNVNAAIRFVNKFVNFKIKTKYM